MKLISGDAPHYAHLVSNSVWTSSISSSVGNGWTIILLKICIVSVIRDWWYSIIAYATSLKLCRLLVPCNCYSLVAEDLWQLGGGCQWFATAESVIDTCILVMVPSRRLENQTKQNSLTHSHGHSLIGNNFRPWLHGPWVRLSHAYWSLHQHRSVEHNRLSLLTQPWQSIPEMLRSSIENFISIDSTVKRHLVNKIFVTCKWIKVS